MKILTRHNIQRSKQQINMSKVFLNQKFSVTALKRPKIRPLSLLTLNFDFAVFKLPVWTI